MECRGAEDARLGTRPSGLGRSLTLSGAAPHRKHRLVLMRLKHAIALDIFLVVFIILLLEIFNDINLNCWKRQHSAALTQSALISRQLVRIMARNAHWKTSLGALFSSTQVYMNFGHLFLLNCRFAVFVVNFTSLYQTNRMTRPHATIAWLLLGDCLVMQGRFCILNNTPEA